MTISNLHRPLTALIGLLLAFCGTGLTAQSMAESFQVDQSKSTFLRARRGAIVYVPAQSFVDQQGNIPPVAIVRLRELIDNKDLFKFGIATVNRDSVLVTGGIIYLEAKNIKGEELQLVDNAPLTLQIPGDNPTASIRIAVGELLDTNRLTKVDGGKAELTVPQIWSTNKLNIDIIQPGQLVQVQSVGGRTISVDDANRVKSGFSFKITKLGWYMLYNRIRDVSTTENTADLTVITDRPDVRMILIPRRFTALVTPTPGINKSQFYFRGLPQEETYTLICYSISGAQYFYTQRYIAFGKNGLPVKKGKSELKLQLQSVSLEYLRAALSAF